MISVAVSELVGNFVVSGHCCAAGRETQAPCLLHLPAIHQREVAGFGVPGLRSSGIGRRRFVFTRASDGGNPNSNSNSSAPARRSRAPKAEQSAVKRKAATAGQGSGEGLNGDATKVLERSEAAWEGAGVHSGGEGVYSGQESNEEEQPLEVAHPSSKLMFSYPSGPNQASLIQSADMDEIAAELASSIEELSRKAVEARGVFSMVLSGGSLVKALAQLPGRSIAWDRCHVFWADERAVPLDHPDSNYKAAKDEFLAKVPIPPGNIHAIDDSVPVESAAELYEANLRRLVAEGVLTTTTGEVYPRFDLVLLGLGPDGHVASLFPNSPLLSVRDAWVLPISNSPKPPPQRITLSLPTINSAREVFFVAAGKSKAFTLYRVLERAALPGSLPAQMVHPYRGQVTWFVDSAAVTDLHFEDWGNAKKYPYLDFAKGPKA